MSKQSKQNALSVQKLLAWVESEQRKPEQLIGGENSFGHPDPISEFEGRIWAYKLVPRGASHGHEGVFFP
ncbi:MAG: hypothetical protein DMG76_16240 [Acidobacteria bacterium]|nr:MAG: hypothetical protein DMG76_16240 [Acidobacteriota bacterium]